MDDARARFDAFARVDGPWLLRLAYQLTHDRHDAQDLAQTVLVRTLASVTRRGRWPDNPRAYVRRTAINEFLRRSPGPIAEPLDGHAYTVAADDTFDQRDAVWTALSRLSPRQRSALVLRYYEDLDDAAIAAIMACRRATVRSLVARGLRALEPALAAEGVIQP